MKKILITLITICSFGFAQAQMTKDISTTLSFTNEVYDFGKIPVGKPVKYQVEIKNISKDSVTLENVQPMCGCTTPEYEKGKRLAPTETTIITLGYNAAAEGPFQKGITINFSDGMSKTVNFKGETFKVSDTPAPTNAGVKKMKTATN